MRKIPPHPNNRIARVKHSAQALVEFALISLLLFTLLVGILEMGRMMFLFTQVSSAAQEGTRFGIIHPYQIISTDEDGGNSYPVGSHTPSGSPCNIVSQARVRVVLIPTQRPLTDTQTNILNVEVGFDHGDSSVTNTYSLPPADPPGFTAGLDRVVVTTSYTMSFLTPLLSNFGPLNLRMVSARTIMADEEQIPNPVTCPEGEPDP